MDDADGLNEGLVFRLLVSTRMEHIPQETSQRANAGTAQDIEVAIDRKMGLWRL